MILNSSDYNPFPAIKARVMDKTYSLADMDFIKKEMFKGGIAPETDEEFDQILNMLAEMDII